MALSKIFPRSVHLFGSCILLIVTMLFALPASATQVLNIQPQQMMRESHVVVHAQVVSQDIRWERQTKGDRGRILTLTRLRVIQWIKGNSGQPSSGQELTIYQVGGDLDGFHLHIPGALNFQKGEEMVFFGMKHRDMLVSYGMGLGKYLVKQVDGRSMVSAAYGDVSFVERSAKGVRSIETPQPKARTLKDFIRLINVQPSNKGSK